MPKDPLTARVFDPLVLFAKQSHMLLRACSKPDRREFARVVLATGAGFCIIGFLGFFVKLVHIPIYQIIASNFF